MYHFMYRFVPAVSGFHWTSLDREKGLKPNRISDLQHSVDFGGSPWKVDVERAMGIEPTYAAWEAAVLPLNYTRDVNLRARIVLDPRAFAAPLTK